LTDLELPAKGTTLRLTIMQIFLYNFAIHYYTVKYKSNAEPKALNISERVLTDLELPAKGATSD